jgi:predicted nuclease of restriction endonuclease-like (RecB) superfamily
MTARNAPTKVSGPKTAAPNALVDDVRQLILNSRQRASDGDAAWVPPEEPLRASDSLFDEEPSGARSRPGPDETDDASDGLGHGGDAIGAGGRVAHARIDRQQTRPDGPASGRLAERERMPIRKTSTKLARRSAPARPKSLVHDMRQLILEARQQTAAAVNAALTTLYWEVGRRIRQDILKEKRAEYGEEILQALSAKLRAEFGRGFSQRNLANMVRFAEAFPDIEILHALRAKLGWSHFKQIIYIDDRLKRDFYAEMCRVQQWSTRTLEKKIGSMLYERTALSRKPATLIEQEIDALRAEDKLTPDLVFQDPYFLDFLGLKGAYSEKDLEEALIREVERFLLELGTGFAFVERQKRITIGGDDYYMDLLFFHRDLHRLVVIELKLDNFKPADAGQVELYLRWLDRHERKPGEEAPMAIILCSGKKETVEYLSLGQKGIHVAEYLTKLPSKAVLLARLHEAARRARQRLESQATGEEGA